MNLPLKALSPPSPIPASILEGIKNNKFRILSPPKSFKHYQELIECLRSKGMIIDDPDHAERKLSQIGYYRLSGFWYPCRVPAVDKFENPLYDPATKMRLRKDKFYAGTNFRDIIDLYLFDKKLRLLLLDGLERIEIYVRSIIAHELGKKDPIAYRDPKYIHPKSLQDYFRDGVPKNNWRDWFLKNNRFITDSKSDCILWHRNNYRQIPFWVVVETWDFGLMSNYFNILGDKHKDDICARIGIKHKKTLNNWLKELNFVRNKCAHHSRVWNMRLHNPLSIKGVKDETYFKNLNLASENSRKRIYGCICILWRLIQEIGPSSSWITTMANHIDSLPKCEGIDMKAMGFPDECELFPRDRFNIK